MRRMDIYENNAKLNQKSKTEQTLKLYTSWQNNIAQGWEDVEAGKINTELLINYDNIEPIGNQNVS